MKTKTKFKILFIVILILISILGVILAVDMYYHDKYLHLAGLNHKGYRGEVLGEKEQDEIRIAMVGGCIVFGYGIYYNETIPARLEEILNKEFDKKVSVINMAYNTEGAYAFYYNLSDFFHLDYDYVIFYAGYTDMSVGNTTIERHGNPVYRTFGYMPILPLLLMEKMMLIRSGGQLDKAYRGEKIVFKPNSKEKVTIAALNKTLEAYSKIENVMNRLNKLPELDFDKEKLKEDEWAWYKYYMKKAIDFALAHDKKVIVISPPAYGERYTQQQEAVKQMLDENYNGNENVFYANLSNALPLDVLISQDFVFDGFHINQKGSITTADLINKKIRGYIYKNEYNPH